MFQVRIQLNFGRRNVGERRLRQYLVMSHSGKGTLTGNLLSPVDVEG